MREALSAQDERAGREAIRRALELDRHAVGQVARASGVSTASRGGLRMTHSPPNGKSRAGSSIAAVADSRRMARDIASSRAASESVRIASRRRTGSNSN